MLIRKVLLWKNLISSMETAVAIPTPAIRIIGSAETNACISRVSAINTMPAKTSSKAADTRPRESYCCDSSFGFCCAVETAECRFNCRIANVAMAVDPQMICRLRIKGNCADESSRGVVSPAPKDHREVQLTSVAGGDTSLVIDSSIEPGMATSIPGIK